jgi:hypothetical protein
MFGARRHPRGRVPLLIQGSVQALTIIMARRRKREYSVPL